MTFALVLACTVAACFALRNPLKACPMAFYAAALLVDVAFVAGTFWGMPRDAWSVFFVLIQKCLLPLALFVVVMYIGVLDRGSRACMWLKPVRAELSIVAWLLSLGHVAVYGATSFAVAVVLLALLAVLGVTSFNLVKRRMRTETWKKVQKLAYPFFLLTYVHLLLMLAPSALHGGVAATTSVAVYSIVFAAYVVLRLVRAAKERRIREAV